MYTTKHYPVTRLAIAGEAPYHSRTPAVLMAYFTYTFTDHHHTLTLHLNNEGVATISKHDEAPTTCQLPPETLEAIQFSFPQRAFEQGRSIEHSALELGFGEDAQHIQTRSPMLDDPVYQRFLETIWDAIEQHANIDIRPTIEAPLFTQSPLPEERPVLETLNQRVIVVGALCTIPVQWFALWLAKKIGAYFVITIGPFGILLAAVLMIAFSSVATYAAGYIIGHRHDVSTSDTHALFVGAAASLGTFILLVITGTFWWPMLFGLILSVYLAKLGGASAERQKFLPF